MRLMIAAIATAIVWIAVAPAVAHHAFSAEFDFDKPVTLTGTVTSVRWSNPHAWIYIDVQGDDGMVVNWALEFGGANSLYRRRMGSADAVSRTASASAARSSRQARRAPR